LSGKRSSFLRKIKLRKRPEREPRLKLSK